MKAIIYHSYDDIRLENRSIPTINETELLVRVHGCGLCGSDILKITQQAPPPVILGHELTGTIVECGKAVSDFEVGQRVIVAHHVPCGTCHYCRHQNSSMCAAFKASNIDPCGFAEYIRVPTEHARHTTLLLPETLSAEEGSFVEPLACCVRAVRRTPLLPGDSVVVMGLGSVGLLMLQAVKALGTGGDKLCLSDCTSRRLGRSPFAVGIRTQGTYGAVQVYGVDLLPERLQLARDLGVDAVFQAPPDEQGLGHLFNPLRGGRGADAVILTAPGVRPFLQAVASVRKGGTINIFAAHNSTAPLNLETIYAQELTITSSYSSSPGDLRIALDLLAHRKVSVNRLISHRLPLESFDEGVLLMRERAALKVYFPIVPDSVDYSTNYEI